MRTIWQSLAWKEWHEHKWKLASVTTIVVAVSSLPIFYYDRIAMSIAAVLAIFCIAPLAVFIGAGEATGERARGTLPFTQALPVPIWHVAIQKLIAGLLTCALPILFNLAVLAATYHALVFFQVDHIPVITNPLGQSQGTVSLSTWFWYSAIPAMGVAASFFLWTSTIGVNRKDEISASAWALALFVVWWTLLLLIPTMFFARVPTVEYDWLIASIAAISPGGYPFYLNSRLDGVANGLAHVAAWLVPLVLAVTFVRRFGRSAVGEARSPANARALGKSTNWLDRPMTTSLRAIAWKQFRESGPIALAGIAGVIGTTLVILVASPGANASDLGSILAAATSVFGLVATLVVGIGIFLNDLTPSLHSFWRSRPISVNVWFWTKYAVGILVLVAAFATPLVAAVWIGASHEIPNRWERVMWFVLLPLWTYSATVMTTALVRQAVYAGILSCAAMYVSILLVVGTTRLVKLGSGTIKWEELSDPTEGEMAAAMFLATIVFTLIAWLAVRNDWGRKSRY